MVRSKLLLTRKATDNGPLSTIELQAAAANRVFLNSQRTGVSISVQGLTRHLQHRSSRNLTSSTADKDCCHPAAERCPEKVNSAAMRWVKVGFLRSSLHNCTASAQPVKQYRWLAVMPSGATPHLHWLKTMAIAAAWLHSGFSDQLCLIGGHPDRTTRLQAICVPSCDRTPDQDEAHTTRL